MYYAVKFGGGVLSVCPLGRDELVAFAKFFLLEDGEEVYIPKALEPTGEGVAFPVRARLVLGSFLAGGLQGGAPLGLYLGAGFGRRGLGPRYLLGDALGIRAGGGQLARKVDGITREVRPLARDLVSRLRGLDFDLPQSVPPFPDRSDEIPAGPRDAAGY